MEILKHDKINHCPSIFARSDSGEECWIKVIDIKSDYPIQKSRDMIKHYYFNSSNDAIISWSKKRIKKIKRTIRRVSKSIKAMKARKSKAKKIDRDHEIPNDDQDYTQIDSKEVNEDWIKGSSKEVSKIMEYKFGDFYPKDWTPPGGYESFPLQMHYELKHDIRKKSRLAA